MRSRPATISARTEYDRLLARVAEARVQIDVRTARLLQARFADRLRDLGELLVAPRRRP